MTGAVGAEAGENGSGAAGRPDAPTVDISGRWAMFQFEDPVGVQLVQTGGVLTGQGCVSGVPPLDSDPGPYCGGIQGTVTGNHASFVFHPLGDSYIADATVSSDGMRMTSRFHGVSWLPFPTAWLRVADGQIWLTPASVPGQPYASGSYQLILSSAAPGATEYLPDTTYHLIYDRGRLSGDLGSFWTSEISPLNDSRSGIGSFRVGPVPETDPALPVSLSMDIGAGVFTHVAAVTGSGHAYEFSASVVPN
jgi:hypothetical protein